jgi:phosphoesterase RecJ-like protein
VIAQHYGGGGHIRAAGCEIRGSLEDVKALLIEKAGQVLGI